MKTDREGVIKIWNERITSHVNEYKNYDLTPQLKKMMSLFVPGRYYFWVLNFKDLSMDYVHPGVQDILKADPETFTIQKFFSLLPPEQMEMTKKKEDLVTDFLFNFLQPEEIMDYKIIFDLKIHDTEGNLKHILHQATTLSQSESGRVQHVMSIHTEVSHLNFNLKDTVSFIHLNGGSSYFNLNPENPHFSPENAQSLSSIKETLSLREIEIVQETAKGRSSEEIANKFVLTKNTVDTHRRKIINKTNCKNINEVVTQAILEGVV